MVIWCLETKNAIWSCEYGVQMIDGTPYGSERLRNQYGKFTLSRTPFKTLEEYVEAHGDEVGDARIRFEIPADNYEPKATSIR